LAKDIVWLKSLKLTYNNLKPKNVLVNKQDYVKIKDFNYTNFIGLEFKVYILLYKRFFSSKARLKKETINKLKTYTK
jgi:hypothetical protein